ncbi:MAG: uncharacterized protein QOG77_3274 [Solirubrobacteraceae bacterium]|nr:uncharacterized protein [Solirubrobacteraceae bacterium]
MELHDVALLVAAGFGAGAINAMAGGGSLVSFPALLATGLPSVTANVTNAIAVLPGYIGGTVAYRDRLRGRRRRGVTLGLASGLGSGVGAVTLLVSPESIFDAIVPFLILLACGLLAVQSRVRRFVVSGEHGGAKPRALHISTFLAAIYGGYFGAGLGIALLAILGVLLPDDLQSLNALKGLLSLVIAAVAAVFFVVAAPVAWTSALCVGAASLVGGVAGARLAQRIPDGPLRTLVIVYGVVVAVVLLVRG